MVGGSHKNAIACFLAFLLFVSEVSGECINGCSGHGECKDRDLCDCYRNFMGADCSQRVCPFDFAYVDTPKGDLDSSGTIDSYLQQIGLQSQLYPFGTTEEWPRMQNSDFEGIDNTAHWYRECSNNGYCNRKTGECECLEPFWGSTCNRRHCPGYPDSECSGRGQCLNIQDLAKNDYNHVYELWDKKISYGCLCDYGYSGGACEIRHCKKAVDPMYMDDVQTLKFPIMHLAILTTSDTMDFTDSQAQPQTAYLKVRVFDGFGKPWYTDRLTPGFTCEQLVTALEEIPNAVIPAGNTGCTRTSVNYANPLNSSDIEDQFTFSYHTNYNFTSGDAKAMSFRYRPVFWDAGFRNSYDLNDTVAGNITGDIYRLDFHKNPGFMRPLEVETFLGQTMQPHTISSGKTIFKSWTDGQQGEDDDYFANHCKGVKVQVVHTDDQVSYLSGFDSAERNLLKACLGGSDFDPSNNVEIYDWDYGSTEYPHIVRLLRTSTHDEDGGYYVVLYFDTTVTWDDVGADGTFRLLHPFRGDYTDAELSDETQWEVYTTNAVLQLTSNKTKVTHDFASNMIFTHNSTDTTPDQWHGDMSCQLTDPGKTDVTDDYNKLNYVATCLNKGDIVMFLDPETSRYNPQYLNMYTIKALYNERIGEKFLENTFDKHFSTSGGVFPQRAGYLYNSDMYKTPIMVTDLTTNWANAIDGDAVIRIYKFYPAANSTYHYVSECANRGICNTYDGICDCFNGYTGDACTEQNALAV